MEDDTILASKLEKKGVFKKKKNGSIATYG